MSRREPHDAAIQHGDDACQRGGQPRVIRLQRPGAAGDALQQRHDGRIQWRARERHQRMQRGGVCPGGAHGSQRGGASFAPLR